MSKHRLSSPEFRAKVLAFVLEKAWRSENTVIDHFCVWIEDENGDGHRHRAATRGMVEDALFDLVTDEELIWFGAENRFDKPMRYRLHPSKKAKVAA